MADRRDEARPAYEAFTILTVLLLVTVAASLAGLGVSNAVVALAVAVAQAGVIVTRLMGVRADHPAARALAGAAVCGGAMFVVLTLIASGLLPGT